MGRISTERANRIYYEAKQLKASMTEEDKAKRKEAQRYAPAEPSNRSNKTTSSASTSSPKANAKYVPMDTADNQYAQALAAFNPGGTFVPRAAQEEIAARKAANHSRYMDALDTSTRAGVAAAGSGTVRSVMDTSETQAIKNEIAGKMAAREKDRTNAGKHFRSVRGNDDYRDRVLGFDNGALPYGRTDTARLRYALDEDYRGQIDTFNQRQGLLENPYDNLKYLTDEERRDLRYYASRGEYDRANEYLDYLAPDLNARMQGIASNEMARLSEEQPVAGVLANIAASREAGLGVLPTIRGAVKEQMGIYEPVDTNGVAFRAAHMLRDTTEGVGNAAYNAAGGGIAGDTARFLAEAGLSAAQNASLLPMGGTAPLVFMGSMAAGQSALDTLESGGTAQDALKVAAATGIIETATEKIGIENFFRISRLGKKGIQQLLKEYKLGKPLVNNIKSFAGDLGTQMAAEGAEEMIAEVAENLADTAIRGDNGQYAQLVQSYMANGMSEEQAKARAFTDMYIDNVLKAGAQGAVAGGMLGAGGAAIGTRYNNEVTAVGAQLAELDITPEQLISAVQQSGSKDAQDFARELSRKLVLGQEVTLADMGQLHLLSNNYITSKDYEAVQKAAIAEEEARNAGGNVRGSEQNLRGREAAAGVQQNAGNAAEAQQGESLQKPQNQSVGTQTATKAQTGAIDVASKATNNTESIEPTAGQVTGEAPSVQAPQTTENAPKEARQPTTYEQGAQVQTPQGEGTVVMTADNTVAVRLANGTTEIFKTADLSSTQVRANEGAAVQQSSAAQTATGNTVANARANEANTGGRSETAAQPKTVAETSWENIQKIVQTKAKGGLSQKDEYTMNSAGRRAFDRIGRALGVEIHFVDRIVNEEGEANGLYQNGHIFIARNAENPYHVVLAHEITHHFEKTAPDVYEKFKGAALEMNPGLVERYMAMWGYDEATAEFEVAADFAGQLLEKESTVKRVIKEDISAARGFHRAMNAVFDKVRGDDTKGLTEEEKKLDAQLDAARDMWRRCLRETRDEKAETDGGESKGQLSRKLTPEQRKLDADYLAAVERGDMETAQRMVDEAAKQAMPGTKAVDKNGKLLRAYHGTKEQFTAFLRDEIGSLGRFEGSGFNFTPSEGRAKNYGGNVLSVYLDISKPLNAQKKTITVPQLAQIIRQADPTGDNIIANYASSVNDYGTERFVARESLLVARSIWDFCENDVDIYSALSVANIDAEGLIETFEKLGYDGAIHYDGYGEIKTLIAFSSNQIKSADPVTYDDDGNVIPLSERFNEKKDDIRFSMKQPVEYTKNLVALHNLSSDKLGKTLDLGGFPMPSIAVTRNDIPHTNFGDISLVMKRETIDPKANKRNTVYSADAWTPVFPQVEYEADEKKAAKLRRKYYDLEKRFGREAVDALYPWGNYADDHLNRVGGEAAAIERYRDDTDMMKVFLADTKGKVPEPVTKETVTRLSDDQIRLYDHIIGELGRGAVYAIKSGDFENPLQRRKKWFEKYGDRMKAAYKSYLTGLGLSAEEADNAVSQETMGSLTRHVLAAQRYMENGPETTKTEHDFEATREAIRKATNKKAYETWLKDLFGGIEKASGLYNYKERYTPGGNLRSFAATHYPVTLENIVKAMRSENGGNTKNVSGFHGVKTLRAGTAVRFKSVEHMHELERRLQHLTDEEAEQISDALEERLIGVIRDIYNTRADKSGTDNYFIIADEIGETLEEIAESGKYTLTDIRKTFEKYRYPITTEIAQDVKALLFDISEMPVNMFEAKPERVVGFDEVLAAVVPSDIDPGLKRRIENAGMRTIEYEAGSDESRLAAVNSVEGAKFSRKGQTLSPEFKRWFGDWQNDPENASKVVNEDGTPKVMYHASEAKDINIFQSGNSAGTIYFALSDKAAKKGARGKKHIYEAYLSAKKPVNSEKTAIPWYDAEDSLKVAEWRRKGFDSVYVKDESGVSIAVFSPEQIKSATANVGTFDRSNPDIRYSRKGQDVAMRRANRLARENARLKGQFKLTRGVKLRESDIRKVTRELLKEYEIIDYDKEQFERYIKMMAEAAAQAGESNADATWDSIRNVARGLSHEVGRAAFARYADVDEEYDADLVRETYEDIRRHLGRQRVLNPWFKDPWVENESPQRKEMRDYYRRKLFGVLTLTSDRSVDKGPLGDIGKLYEGLTETFGEAYFPSDVTNDKDQIMRIADVLDDLKDTLTQIGERTPVTVAEDVEQSSRDETRRAAYEDEVYGELYARLEEDILNRIAEVRREKPTFADKKKAEQYAAVERAIEQTQSKAEAAEIANRIEDARKYRERIAKLEARLNKLKEENKGLKGKARQTQKDIREADTYYRQAAREALREAKAQKREALQELKDKYKAKTAEAREKQNARELRKKIERHTGELYKKLTKPTNEKHINEDVRPAAALLISLINQESLYTTDYQTGKPVRPGTPPRLTDNGLPAARIANKRTEAARKMKKAAEQIFAGEDNYLLIYDPELMENLAIMEDWSDKPLVTMSSAELQVVWDAVRGVEHMITQSRKVFNEGRQWEIGTLASGLVRDVDLTNPRRTIKYGAAASVDKLLNIDQLTPQAFFHRFGEGGDRLFRMLRRSQDKYVRIIADIQSRTAEVIKDIDIDKLNKDIATYKVKGGDVTLSRAQVLLLYASIKREQAAGHILGGGIKAKPLKGKGLFETKQLLPVEVTQEDLDNMFKEAKLTEAEKKAADGLVNIMSTALAEYGNEASLRTYGYAKFREGWYVPIETDPTSNKTDNNDPLFKQFTAAASIAGRGFAKQTKEGAKNAIMVGSLFDVYAKHVNDMAMYAAYVETLENMRRVRNFKFKDGTKTQNYIEALLTKSGVAYWDKLIRDINGGERLNNDDFSFDRFVGAYKAAAVSANIRVILQQPTAIIRAAAEINPAYLIAAMRKIPKRHEWERIKNNVGIAQWKDWGYFDINTGRQMRDVVLGTDSLFEKFKQAGMRPMSGADSFAWTLLYHACEDEAKAKGLRPGDAAFDSFVASRFSDIIDKTQVVDGVLQRSQIMRSTNAVTKMATSFMAEPTKTYNMFLSAVWDFRHARSKTEKQAARKKLGFTVAALVVSFLTNAAAQSLIDALRDDDRDKEFLDKFWDAYLGRPEEDDKNKAVTVMGGNLWTAFNPVTYIPFFKDIVSLVQGFDTKRMDMESIGRVIDAAEQALAAAKGEGKQTALARALALASEVSRVFGLPVANIKRDSVAVLNTIAQEKKDYGMMYNVDRAFYKLDKNVSRYVDIMLKAHDAGDTETEKRITDDLHAAGVDDKKIKSAADTIRKKQEGVDSTSDLKERYRPYDEAAKYNKLEAYAKGTSAYRQANTTERSKYEKMLEDALANNDTAQGRHEKAREIGVSDNQYMEFLIAQDVANRQRNDGTGENEGKPGGVSKNDYIAALDMTSMTQSQKREAFALKYPKSKTGNPYA